MSLRSARRFAALVVSALAVWALATGATAGVLAPFQETPVITGLTNPTAVRFAPDGRIFVSEQSGLLKVFNGLGDATPDIAADLRTQVINNWDRGFLGLAIDPQFPAAGHDFVYVLYTVDAPPGQNPPVWNDACADQTTLGCVTRGRLSRLQIGPDNAQIGPEQILVDDRWCFQFVTHSVGDLRFGPEGALYVSGGEGASFGFIDHGQAGNACGDPPNEGGALRSQDILTPGDSTSWDGSLLRLDVSGPTAVPWPTNTQVGAGAPDDDAIIAHGLRNPFRFTIHPGPGPQAGEVWVGDVGADTWEEIDRMPAPTGPLLNFGWPCYEGGSGATLQQPGYSGANLPICQGLYNATIPSQVTPSVFAYNHGDHVVPGEQCTGTGGGSITGVAFYANGNYPTEYQGALFFEDFSRRCLWAMLPDTPGGVPNPANRREIVWNSGSGSVDLQVGPGGDLYYAEYSSGRITRLEYFATNAPPAAVLNVQPSSGASPLSVSLDASLSTDSNPGDTLTYTWDLDGDGQFDDSPDADPRFAHFSYTQPGTVTVSVRVTDSLAASSSASQILTVANSPPVATILTPPATTPWRVGDEIFFSGSGTDPEEGPLPAAALSWQTILHQCTAALECHSQPVQAYTGVDHGSFLAPDPPYPSYLEIQLTAKDSGTVGWFDLTWSARRRILFNNSTQTTALVGFPVLVRLDSTNVDYQKTQNAGQDLRFTDSDGTLLPHQIETWNEAGTSYVWVRVPQIDAASSTDSILMYYGNPTAPDAQSPTAVWDATFGGVWHMGVSTVDSTSHANNGVDHGSSPVSLPGQIGSARNFDGFSWIEVASSPSLEIANTVTLEAWVKVGNPALGVPTRILDKKFGFADPEGYDLEYLPSGHFATVLGSGSNFGRADGVDLGTEWHWLAATISGTTAHVYADGVDRTTDSSVSSLVAGSLPLNIGRNPAQGAFFFGGMDELRISNVVRSPDWMRAQYLSMTGAFTSMGSEEGSGRLTGTASVSIQPETRSLAFSTSPTGLQVTVGSSTQTAPFTRTVITNSLNSVSTTSPQPIGGVDQLFANWSDGGAQSHEITATPQFSGLTATFLSALCGNGALDEGEQCDDGNVSSGDCCSALCQLEANGSTCSDGNACNSNDVCDAGVCRGGAPVDCEDSNACTADSCSSATGCVHDPQPNGTTCSDGNACTTTDACSAGACVGSGTLVCSDSNACTADSCNPASGCVHDPAPLEGTTCSDGDACTTAELCTAGVCSGGGPVSCEDSNACTSDSCNSATGCVHDPAPQNGATCNDGNACTTADVCSAGACVGGGTVVCNDANGCTFDTCVPASGCLFDPAPLNGTTCSDAEICTLGDVCSAGACVGTPAPDGDVDGECNANDNCPYEANPGQEDTGGITLLIPDGIGNICQCGDLTAEGLVDETDVLAYRNHLADPTGLPLLGGAALKCNVAGGDPAECNLLDVVITQRALLGQAPGIAQVCGAAIPH